jgi:ankyrin repeat protein
LLAVQNNNTAMIQALLDRGADPNLAAENGLTPLILAAEIGNVEAARLLADKGANIHAHSSDGYDVVAYAALHGKKEMVQFLFDRGAKVTPVSSFGDLLAAANGGLPELAVLAIATGANVNAEVDPIYIIPFFRVLHRDTVSTVVGGRKALRTTFSDTMCLMMNDAGLRMSPLRTAVINRREEIAAFLLDKGIDFSTTANRTAIYEAVANRLPETLRLALEKGFDVKVIMDTSQFKMNAFALACDLYPLKGDSEVIDLLLRNGINVNAKDAGGRTELKKACIYNNKTGLVKLLLDRGADIEIGDEENTTPLIQAAYNGCDETITLLLDRGANVNATETVTRKNSVKGRTALMAAALRGQVGSVYLLLAGKGIRINAKDDEGKTALKYAIEKNQTAIIDLLKKAGATD